ncbi:MAG: hypothetical protein WBV90_07860 [Terrimicrobiaceae bacterium]
MISLRNDFDGPAMTFWLVVKKPSFLRQMVVKRPKLSLVEQFYLPAIVTGLAITLKHLRKLVSGKTKATMQYPRERWDSQLPPLVSRCSGID